MTHECLLTSFWILATHLVLFLALLSMAAGCAWSPAAPLLPLSCFSLASSLISSGFRTCLLRDDIKVAGGPWVSSCNKFSAAAGRGGMTGSRLEVWCQTCPLQLLQQTPLLLVMCDSDPLSRKKSIEFLRD